MPTPRKPEDFRDMDEPLNVEGDPDEVMRALLALDADDATTRTQSSSGRLISASSSRIQPATTFRYPVR